MTTSWVVLFGSLPTRLYPAGLTCKAAWKHQRVTFAKDRIAGDLVEGVGTLGASAIAAARGPVVTPSAHRGPLTVKLFIGFLWVSGKITMFYVGKCLALIVEYIPGCFYCCCFLVFLSFMSFKSSPHPEEMFSLLERTCSQGSGFGFVLTASSGVGLEQLI